MQVKGGSHCPVELMLASAHTGYCLTLESAGLAAKLPFSQAALWEKKKGTALSPACREQVLDDIFSKHLLLLIPFYIFSHEKDFKVYNSNEQRLAELKAEYRNILDKLEQEGTIGAFDKRTIIELSSDVIKEIAQKYENVQKGVGDIMGGALIETEARTILNRGKAEGRNENKKETAFRMLRDGVLPIEKIAEYSGLDIAEVELLVGLQNV